MGALVFLSDICVFLSETPECSCFPVRDLCIRGGNTWVLMFSCQIFKHSCQQHLDARVSSEILLYSCQKHLGALVSCQMIVYSCQQHLVTQVPMFSYRILVNTCLKHLSARVFLSDTRVICASFSKLWNAI
jgi:hypothetical protein